MKKAWNKNKWVLRILANALPFIVDIMLFAAGGMFDLLWFPPVFVGLIILNFLNCKNVIPYILYQAFMLVCIICAGCASTCLYYCYISNDSMTLLVGTFMVLLGAGINIVTTVITAIIKGAMQKKRTCNENG